MPSFVILLHHDPRNYAEYSPERFQQLIAKYRAWAAPLEAEGRLQFARKLVDDGGRHVRRRGGRIEVKDGPFNETKEVVGGFYVLQAESYEEVVALLADHPQHEIGGTIEVRRVDLPEGRPA